MTVSQDTERAVDRQAHELLDQGNGHFTGLTQRLLVPDVDVSEQGLALFVERESHDVGGPVPPQEGAIELTDGLVVEEGN